MIISQSFIFSSLLKKYQQRHPTMVGEYSNNWYFLICFSFKEQQRIWQIIIENGEKWLNIHARIGSLSLKNTG